MLARSLWQMRLPIHKQAPHLHHPKDRLDMVVSTPKPLSALPSASRQLMRRTSFRFQSFARVIWQESRFDARAVSSKGVKVSPDSGRGPPVGTASPTRSIPWSSLRHWAAYLRKLLHRFGNLGLAAAAYNTSPAPVSAWLTSHRPLPGEPRNYVALVTGWTADEWASSSPPEKADTTIPQGCPALGLPI